MDRTFAPRRSSRLSPYSCHGGKIATLGPKARYEENYRIVRPDGEIRWIMDKGFPIYNKEGKCSGVTGIAIDVTKEKLIPAPLQKLTSTEIAKQHNKIQTTSSGMINFSDLIQGEMPDKKIEKKCLSLTKRELDCLNNLVLGYSTKEIAKVLGLSPRTVEDYLQNAKDKLRCSKKSEVIQIMLSRNSMNINKEIAF